MLSKPKTPLPIQVYNLFAGKTRLANPLNHDKILAKARKNTGLIDLGNDYNEEALQVLINSINSEARLHPFGQLMIKEKLIGQLENRLWATHWFKKHPEILEQEVLPIILVTGLQRTGTTKMQRLLSDLPDARALLSWEALYPAPIGAATETDKRIARTRRNERAVKYISPTFQSIHPIHCDQPEEDVLLLDVHFMSTTADAILEVPSYASWLRNQDQVPVYAYEKKLLQLLQWQRGGKFWVLKSPHHLEFLTEFTTVFPDSKVVWMHRSPEECVPSFLSMLYYSRAMFSDKVDKQAIKEHWLGVLKTMIDKGQSLKKLNPFKVIDIAFTKFVENEVNVVNKIAHHSGIEMPNIITTININPYKSKHRYNLSDWNLNSDELRQYFSEYQNSNTTLLS